MGGPDAPTRMGNFEGEGRPIVKYVCRELCKIAWTDRDAVSDVDLGGFKEALLDGRAYWRHLANTIEPSICGGDASFLSNYFDHLFSIVVSRFYRIIRNWSLLENTFLYDTYVLPVWLYDQTTVLINVVYVEPG